MSKIRVLMVCLVMAGTIGLGMRAFAQEKAEAPHKIVRYGDLKWTPIIKGCDLAAVSGDPNAERNTVCDSNSVRGWVEDSGALASHRRECDRVARRVSGGDGRDIR